MSSKFIKQKQVKLANGKMIPAAKAKKVQGEFYKIGKLDVKNSGEVFFFPQAGKNGIWYRLTSGFIIYDNRQSRYMLKRELEVIVENGIIGFDETNAPVFGVFSKDMTQPETIVIYDEKTYICMDLKTVVNNPLYMEGLSDGFFYERTQVPSICFTEPLQCTREYKNSLQYESTNEIAKAINIHAEQYKTEPSDMVKAYAPLLKDLTFGLEFETTVGVIPDRVKDRLGLIPLRDGSIEGLEYVTIPLQGEVGVQTLLDSLSVLKKYTRFDKDCGFHLHLGGLPRTKEHVIAMFKVLYVLQDELFSMFPLHKKKNYGVKRKDYTKPFDFKTFLKLDSKITKDNIDKNFDVLFRFLSMGASFKNYENDLKNVKVHPSDPGGNRKWQVTTRYYAHNLLPIIFGNKKTIEFRIHTPTYDKNKVMNFIFICGAIINFTKDNFKAILAGNEALLSRVTLQNVIQSEFRKGRTEEFLGEELLTYASRRQQYAEQCISKGDIVGIEDDFKCNTYSGICWNAGTYPSEDIPVKRVFNKKRREGTVVPREATIRRMPNRVQERALRDAIEHSTRGMDSAQRLQFVNRLEADIGETQRLGQQVNLGATLGLLTDELVINRPIDEDNG